MDSGDVVTTANTNYGALSEASLREALAAQVEGATIGKSVLDGFGG